MEKLIPNNFKKEVIMVLVFILLTIFILLTVVATLFISSTINLQVQNLTASNIRTSENKNAKIIVSFKAFDKLKWLSICFDEKKIKKMQQKMNQRKMNLKKLQQNFEWEDLKELKHLKVKLEKLNFNLKFGTASAITTAYSIAFFATLIAILLPFVSKKNRKKNYTYDLHPLYRNQISYDFFLDCIVQVKMVHIINSIIAITKKKKRRSEKHERTSNRRSYGYSHGSY